MTDRRRVVAAMLVLGTVGCSKAAPAPEGESGPTTKPQVSRASAMKVARLRWDASEHPIGLLKLEPRLEWQLSSAERGQQQTAYQVLVASDPALLATGKADVWDSGKVAGSDTIDITYRGPALLARQRGVWTVRVWDKQDRPSELAAPASWEVGPWDEEVEGDWIGRASKPGESAAERERSVTYFRRAFAVPAGFKEARLYATAFGLYEMSINGKPVSEDVLTPGLTDYEKRVLVQTRDVTALVHAGDNVIGGVLAGGWCTARLQGKVGRCGSEPPRLRVALELTLPDGKLQTIESDDDWRYAPGPWLSAHVSEGESYDARRELTGWDAPGFDEQGWLPAVEYDGDTERNVYPDPGVPLRVAAELPALTVTEPAPGSYVFDLGRSIVGWAHLSLEAAAGTALTLRYAEKLEPDGTLALDAARSATDRYVARGAGREAWEPRFSLRRFRYVELRGLAVRPELAVLSGRPVHAVMPVTGSLQTSNAAFNRFFDGIQAEQDRSFLSVPSGSAQPGTLQGAQVFALTACLNRDVQRFYRKWIDDLRDAQLASAAYPEAAPLGSVRDGGAAASAGLLVPWAMYRCYADRSGIDPHVTSMGRWLDGVAGKNADQVWRKELGATPGDVLETGPATDAALVATAELSYSARALAQMLQSGGATLAAEGERFETLAKASRSAFLAEFAQPDGKLKSDTQSAYAIAIARGMLDGEQLQRAGAQLVAALERAEQRPTTGVVGSALLLPALSRIGRDDLAYQVFERWVDPNAALPSGLELGALGEWMYEVMGGIALDPAAPAGRHVLVRPRPAGKLTQAHASFASLYGTIETEWKLEDRVFRLKVQVPVGSSATVWMPFPGAVTEGGAPVESVNGVQVTARPEGHVLELASGSYELSVSVP